MQTNMQKICKNMQKKVNKYNIHNYMSDMQNMTKNMQTNMQKNVNKQAEYVKLR